MYNFLKEYNYSSEPEIFLAATSRRTRRIRLGHGIVQLPPVYADEQTAIERGLDGAQFFGHALSHYYVFGNHAPGRASIWDKFEVNRVDQLVFVSQGGRTRHEHICESLELFAREVMPEFIERAPERERARAERLAPAVRAALDRREPARRGPAGYSFNAAASL